MKKEICMKIKQFFCSHYKSCEKVGFPKLDGYFLGDRVHFFQKVKCKKCEKEFEYRYEDKGLDTSF